MRYRFLVFVDSNRRIHGTLIEPVCRTSVIAISIAVTEYKKVSGINRLENCHYLLSCQMRGNHTRDFDVMESLVFQGSVAANDNFICGTTPLAWRTLQSDLIKVIGRYD